MDCTEIIIPKASVYSQNHKKEQKRNYTQYLKDTD